jgi:hypothetical protein
MTRTVTALLRKGVTAVVVTRIKASDPGVGSCVDATPRAIRRSGRCFRQAFGDQKGHGGAKKADGDDIEGHERHGGRQHENGQEAAPATDLQVALGQLQLMEFARCLRHGGEVAPQYEDVSSFELHRGQTMGDLSAGPAYGKQVYAVTVEEFELARGAADELRFRCGEGECLVERHGAAGPRGPLGSTGVATSLRNPTAAHKTVRRSMSTGLSEECA